MKRLLFIFCLIPSVVLSQSITYTFDPALPYHAPTSDNYYNYQYDQNGNLYKITEQNTQDVTQYTYTTFNKLKKVTKNTQPIAEYEGWERRCNRTLLRRRRKETGWL